MSSNISRVQMHQSCDSLSAAWTPSACRHSDAASDNSTHVNAPYYALTFVASFVRGANNFQVIPIQEEGDTIVYAGYESGKLSKIAVVNYPPEGEGGGDDEDEDEGAASSTEKTIRLKLAPEMRHLQQKARFGPSSLAYGDVGLAERSGNAHNFQQILLDEEGPSAYSLDHGILEIALTGGEALLFEVIG